MNSEVRRILDFWALGRKTEFVFYNQKTGEPFVDLDAGLENACKEAKIEGVTCHALRHTFASRLLEREAEESVRRRQNRGDPKTASFRPSPKFIGRSSDRFSARAARTNCHSERSKGRRPIVRILHERI
jgi:hypothetical protein